MDLTNPAKSNFCQGSGMITPNITALSPGVGLYKMFWVGGVLQCMPAVLHSIGQTFPNTASASGECLDPAVEGKRD